MKQMILSAMFVMSFSLPTFASESFQQDSQSQAYVQPGNNNTCYLYYAGRTETSQEYSMPRCQQRVNNAVTRYCSQYPNANLSVTYRWNGQGDTAFFPCKGWGQPQGGPVCTLRYAGRVEITHEVAMGACQQRVNEAVVRYCAQNPGFHLAVDYRWNGQGATAHFDCAH